MTTWPARPAASVLAALLTLVAGGCTVETPHSKPGPPGAPETGVPVVNGAVRLDLRDPPTAADLGVPAGSDNVSFRRSGSSMLDVDVQLPDGGRLHVPAIAYNVVLAPGPYGNEIVVNRVEPSLDAGEAALLAGADALRFERTEIHSFADEVRATDLNRFGPMNRVFRSRGFGYLAIEVDLRVTPDHEAVLINYQLLWESDARSPSPAAEVSRPPIQPP